MIRATMSHDGHSGRILLAPNNSLSPSSSLYFIVVLGAGCMFLGLIFLLFGAWPILILMMLELAALVWGFRYLASRLSVSQRLVVGPHKIVIDIEGKRICLNRNTSQLYIEDSHEFEMPPKLSLAGEGHTIILGSFLSSRETKILKQLLLGTGIRSIETDQYFRIF